MKLKYHLKCKIIINQNMKTRGIIITRKKRGLNSKGEEIFIKEYLRCRVNAAVPNDHRMITSERL